MAVARTVALLVIDSGGNLLDVDPIRAPPDTHIFWIVSNQHPTDMFKVEVTGWKVKEPGAPPVPPPVGSASHHRTVNAGDFDNMHDRTKPKASFGKGTSLPYTTYKYTVNVTNMTAGTPTVPYDPDLDIPPP